MGPLRYSRQLHLARLYGHHPKRGRGAREREECMGARNPMGRMGLPQELTGPVVLLCSTAGSFMNGADLVVDGGAVVF